MCELKLSSGQPKSIEKNTVIRSVSESISESVYLFIISSLSSRN